MVGTGKYVAKNKGPNRVNRRKSGGEKKLAVVKDPKQSVAADQLTDEQVAGRIVEKAVPLLQNCVRDGRAFGYFQDRVVFIRADDAQNVVKCLPIGGYTILLGARVRGGPLLRAVLVDRESLARSVAIRNPDIAKALRDPELQKQLAETQTVFVVEDAVTEIVGTGCDYGRLLAAFGTEWE